MEKGNASQMRAMIAKSAEVKPEEMAWIGLDDFLAGKKSVTKQEVRDFVEANQVRVEEVTKRGESPIAEGEHVFLEEDIAVHSRTGDPSRDAYLEKHNLNSIHYLEPREGVDGEITNFDHLRIQIGEYVEGKYPEEGRPFKIISGLGETIGTAADLEDAKHQARLYLETQGVTIGGGSGSGQGLTKFSTYTLPGGENYREVLLRLPAKTGAETNTARYEELNNIAARRNLTDSESDEMLAIEQAEFSGISGTAGEDFVGGHYDEKNVLAHMRLNDRTGPDGEKILFVEEIQSDWHQKGRKQGYRREGSELNEGYSIRQLAPEELEADETGMNSISDTWFALINPEGKIVRKTSSREQAIELHHLNEGNPSTKGVPDAPLKKTWHEMAFRRIARMAAEEGYDAIAWTPGKLQAERYDLSTRISEISYDPDTKKLFAYEKDGYSPVISEIVSEDKLADHIGKEAAERLLATTRKTIPTDKGDTSQHILKGADLEIGGEGMKGFYDKMLKTYADKWGKKFGAKVGVTDVETGKGMKIRRRGVDSPLEQETITEKVWTLPVTKRMRDSVLGKGVATFGAAGVAAGLNNQEAQLNGN